MSKLDELIKELCPNGVEYRDLSDVCTFKKGTQLNRDSLLDEGEYPVINGGITPSGYWNEYNVEANTITISQGGASAGFVNYMETPFWAGAHCYYICDTIERLDYRYLYHIIKMYQFELMNSQVGAGIPSVSGKKLGSLQIPLPDLLIQREIVHILDSFTLLTAELTAELTARRQQYEFYRDYLLNFEDDSYSLADDVERLDFSKSAKSYRLDELCGVYDGTHQTPDYKTSGVKFVSVENIKDLYGTTKYISESDFDKYKIKPQKDDVLMTRIGDIGTPAIVTSNEPLAYYVSLALLRPNTDIILSEYLYHFISTRYFRKELNKRIIHTAVPIKINKNDIGKCMITVPSIETQRKLIEILNRFDKLANDMSEGLPAEIEARKQQYEYYRDVLLSFDEERRSQFIKVERERELCRSKALKWLKLGEIASYSKDRVSADCIKSSTYVGVDNLLPNKQGKTISEHVPVAGNLTGYKNGDVLIGNIRPYLKKIWLADNDGGTNGDVLTIRILDTENILPKYLYYVLSSDKFFNYDMQFAKGAKMPRGDKKAVMDYVIPVPSLEEQERIVSILDRFDKLCNDISEGIPAEIEARQKQYEYYRDTLLRFKAKE